jgi:hypothetical protein
VVASIEIVTSGAAISRYKRQGGPPCRCVAQGSVFRSGGPAWHDVGGGGKGFLGHQEFQRMRRKWNREF